MNALYLVAFTGVCVVVLGVMIEAVRNVSKKTDWDALRPVYAAVERPAIQSIDVRPVDPRHSGFVGLSNDQDFQLTA